MIEARVPLMLVLLVLLPALLVALPSQATTLVVTEGFVRTMPQFCDFNECDAQYQLSGDNFSISHTQTGINPTLVPNDLVVPPGQSIDLGSRFHLGGEFLFNGVPYTTTIIQSNLQLTTPLVPAPPPTIQPNGDFAPRPEFLSSSLILSGTFTAQNTVTGLSENFTLNGAGSTFAIYQRITMATENLPVLPAGSLRMEQLQYAFTPVPEPSTFVLLATGLMALLFCRRQLVT